MTNLQGIRTYALCCSFLMVGAACAPSETLRASAERAVSDDETELALGSGSSEESVDRALQAAGSAGSSVRSPEPSRGCLKAAARPSGGSVTQRDRIYAFPEAYDGRTPMPLLLGLHAAGNPNTQLQNLTKGTRLESGFVRVFPKSKGTAWDYNTDRALVTQVVAEALDTYCIDASRVFATGHSSGAQMLVQMLCRGDGRFVGVAPVAASRYCDKHRAIPVLYIQGMKDAQRSGGNGKDVVKVFATSNGCGPEASPVATARCNSTFDRMPVEPGCVAYQGCSAPSLWCSHNDNGYNGTDGRQHGWPCFASNAIADFFASLP